MLNGHYLFHRFPITNLQKHYYSHWQLSLPTPWNIKFSGVIIKELDFHYCTIQKWINSSEYWSRRLKKPETYKFRREIICTFLLQWHPSVIIALHHFQVFVLMHVSKDKVYTPSSLATSSLRGIICGLSGNYR